jgi:beta-glucosidase
VVGLAVAVVLGVVVGAAPTATAAPTGGAIPPPPTAAPVTAGAATGLPTPPLGLSGCPWLESAMAAGDSPSQLAGLTVSLMTLPEKLGEIVLDTSGSYENVNAGVPRLCIPSLTLSDGPSGLAFGDTGVTLLPAPMGIAASFDTSLSYEYGTVVGSEARAQGIDVSQGPNINIDRIPNSGRASESYGEDPLLTSDMGVADIEGIQSQGTMADAKHLAAYQQETNRGALDARVSDRAMQEIYLPPFAAAVSQGDVASIMCAYPRLNGSFQCQDPALDRILQQWGFTGFVRSDLGAVHAPALSLRSGIDLLKPSSDAELDDLVDRGLLPLSTVDADVERVLTEMFAYGLVGRPAAGTPGTPVATPADTAFAVTAAERSAVLLQDEGHVLPLDPSTLRSVAVIGADASTRPVVQAFGSAHVVAPFVTTPLEALRTRLGPGVDVTYADGASTTEHLPTVPSADLTPASGVGHGLTLTVSRGVGGVPAITTVDTVAAATLAPAPELPDEKRDRDQVHANPSEERPHRLPRGQADHGRLADLDPTAASATSVELPDEWSSSRVSWAGTLTVPSSGRYTFSLAGTGAATMTLDGRTAVSDPVAHDAGTWSGSIELVAGRHYRLAMHWTPVADAEAIDIPSIVDLGMSYDSGAIAAAVAAARRAQVAVVFAADYSSETFDRPSLSLPGDQDRLIAAVAAANPRTVVVLNTSGAVLMPWLHQVRGVLEAWYPGEVDGTAVAALLTGDVAPSGHLPVTFPTGASTTGVSSPSQWPGIGYTSTYSEGLEVGYRYDHATGTRPLFPFGFGLTYTTFRIGDASVAQVAGGYSVSAVVTDTGRRAGSDVVQAYLTFPPAAGEPPGQLAAFAPVTLAAGQSRTVTLTVPATRLRAYLGGGWTTVPGTYAIGVGDDSASQPTHVSVTVG